MSLSPDWVRDHFPGLRWETDDTGSRVTRVWNPDRPEQEMLLEPLSASAKVLWPHCQQTFRAGLAEDFSSWDDDSKPWPVNWDDWCWTWLSTMAAQGQYHVRPGKDPVPRQWPGPPFEGGGGGWKPGWARRLFKALTTFSWVALCLTTHARAASAAPAPVIIGVSDSRLQIRAARFSHYLFSLSSCHFFALMKLPGAAPPGSASENRWVRGSA